MYEQINYSSRKNDLILRDNISADWFVNVPKLFRISTNEAIAEKDKAKLSDGDWEYRPDDYYARYCLYLKSDDGDEMQMRAFWCGHFERLYSAKIDLNRADMEISF